MTERTIGIRELKQNASAAVARAAAGEALVVTDHGRPVARLVPLGGSRTSELVTAGLARPPRRLLADLPRPDGAPSSVLSQALDQDREDARY
ncbi:type II toxin-antitoxin system Phd/YefM family antitoxin [uncultured Ornithinimicrobium sp.]|uniref:type II toxin-antitoxin system Phd/YefM family antitoxin n=1 Tax=uncultured Ornithinimicrobium sp. TaxID=259307 RepID=UPI0025955322|nr:type II toxin-antitoxin system prevent-host-death family antitoxin [uncultured Ornithinimicrobium sp.]